ncbi:MAG: glycoside hydrolase family 97 C-terminal domain-containing protein, partial [Saprospiraceae bacterium]
ELNFLQAGRTYEAVIYADGPDAHWESNPYPVQITKRTVRQGDLLSLQLAAGGDCAVSFVAQD